MFPTFSQEPLSTEAESCFFVGWDKDGQWAGQACFCLSLGDRTGAPEWAPGYHQMKPHLLCWTQSSDLLTVWGSQKVFFCASKLSRKWRSAPIFLPGKSHGQRKPGGLQSKVLQRVGRDWARTLPQINTKTIYGKISWTQEEFQP